MLDSIRDPLARLNPVRLILRNPVALKELRGRMRGARAFVVLTIYLGLVIFFMAVAYSTQAIDPTSPVEELDGGQVGRLLFGVVIYVELFLVMFITPTVTTNSISGEHERQTYDLLRTTLLPERTLVGGKLFSALAYVFLLLLATIPLQSIALVFGGVSISEILVMQVVLLATAVLFGTVGVYFSAQTRRTLRANLFTYMGIMAFVMLPFVLFIIFSPILVSNQLTSGQGNSLPVLLFFGVLVCINPFLTMVVSQTLMHNEQALFIFQAQLPNGTMVSLPMPWLVLTVLYLLLSVIIFVMTTRRLQRIEDI